MGPVNVGFDLMGFKLPPGTVVVAQAWSMHRNPDIFPSPDTFSPEGWLETNQPGSAERLARMQQNMMPFGTGSRVCGGQNLAQVMLKVLMAAMVRNLDVFAPSEIVSLSLQ
jgi:cytochrome P450